MLATSTQKTPGQGRYLSTHDPLNPDNRLQTRAQPSQSGWLLGNLNVQAPPAVWYKYPNDPNDPRIEEFVPPNPPQAIGEGKGKTVVWPTAAMCSRSRWTGAVHIPKTSSSQDELCPTGSQTFTGQLLQKRNREASEGAGVKQEAGSWTSDSTIRQDVSQEFGNFFNFDQRSPSTGTTSGDSYHARSSRTSLGKRQRGQIDSLPPEYSTQRVSVHVQNSTSGCIYSTYRDCDLPDNLTLQLPRLVQPRNPEQLQATLLTLRPMIVYAEFMCPDLCRTQGICVHFSFVLGCKKVPDGLICQVCRAKGNEKAVQAERMCARHNNSKLSSFTANLAEDVLATETQSLCAHEILRRSLSIDWDDVPERRETKPKVIAGGQKTSNLPIRTINRQAADCDIAVSSIETSLEDREQVMKKARLKDQNEAKQDDSAYIADRDASQFQTPEEEYEFMLDEAYTAELKAFMDIANQELDNNGIW